MATDLMGRDFTIFRSLGRRPSIRTEQHDSRWLNGQCWGLGGQGGEGVIGTAVLLPGSIRAMTPSGSDVHCISLPLEGDFRGSCVPSRLPMSGGVPASLCLCSAAGQGWFCTLPWDPNRCSGVPGEQN